MRRKTSDGRRLHGLEVQQQKREWGNVLTLFVHAEHGDHHPAERAVDAGVASIGGTPSMLRVILAGNSGEVEEVVREEVAARTNALDGGIHLMPCSGRHEAFDIQNDNGREEEKG